jgi:hypothetical protein
MNSKKDITIAIGTVVVGAVLGLALAPAALAAAPVHHSSPAPRTTLQPGDAYCLTFDQQIAQAQKSGDDPGMTYNVLGADGQGLAESTTGRMGPLAAQLQEQFIADLMQRRAAAIAGGSSCIGYWEVAGSNRQHHPSRPSALSFSTALARRPSSGALSRSGGSPD